jgi:hypothetical protein
MRNEACDRASDAPDVPPASASSLRHRPRLAPAPPGRARQAARLASSSTPVGRASPRAGLLDHLLILGQRHLNAVLAEFIDHYYRARPHQGLGQRRPGQPVDVIAVTAGRVQATHRKVEESGGSTTTTANGTAPRAGPRANQSAVCGKAAPANSAGEQLDQSLPGKRAIRVAETRPDRPDVLAARRRRSVQHVALVARACARDLGPRRTVEVLGQRRRRRRGADRPDVIGRNRDHPLKGVVTSRTRRRRLHPGRAIPSICERKGPNE